MEIFGHPRMAGGELVVHRGTRFLKQPGSGALMDDAEKGDWGAVREVLGLSTSYTDGEGRSANISGHNYAKDLAQTFCTRERRGLWQGVIEKWLGGAEWEELRKDMRDSERECRGAQRLRLLCVFGTGARKVLANCMFGTAVQKVHF